MGGNSSLSIKWILSVASLSWELWECGAERVLPVGEHRRNLRAGLGAGLEAVGPPRHRE